VILGIPIDPAQLYATDDRSYLVWLSTLTERLHRTHDAERNRGS
jgi:hypothetical protein